MLNWDDLYYKRIPAPFRPQIKNETDVSNFSEEFTNMIPADSPAVIPLNGDKLFKVGHCSMMKMSIVRSCAVL